MWSPAITVTGAAGEPLSADEAKEYLRIDDDDFDPQLAIWIAGARAQVERITGTRLLTQTVKLLAGSFLDLEALPIGPVASVTAIAYQDPTGQAQQLDPSRFELFGAGLARGLRPVAGVSWPTARAVDGAITVTAIVGYGDAAAVPGSVTIALLQIVRGLMMGVDVDVTGWLGNDRIFL